MATVINAFVVRETKKNIYVAREAAYISIQEMLRKKAVIPCGPYLKIAKDLIVSRRTTHPAVKGDGFLTTSEIGKNYVDTAHGEEITLA